MIWELSFELLNVGMEHGNRLRDGYCSTLNTVHNLKILYLSQGHLGDVEKMCNWICEYLCWEQSILKLLLQSTISAFSTSDTSGKSLLTLGFPRATWVASSNQRQKVKKVALRGKCL